MQQLGLTSTELKNELLPDVLESNIAKIAQGDKTALAQLYGRVKNAVYGFALSILKNPHDAEDVLQEVFIRIWSASVNYKPAGKPLAWILVITKNLANDKIRERGKILTLSDEQWQLYYNKSPYVSVEDKSVISAALNHLNDVERDIVTLHALTGLKFKEIGSLLSLPTSTVLSKYHRAMKKMSSLFSKEDSYAGQSV